jgi:hypothetical protein
VSVAAYPLQWPQGWKRASWRQRAAFGQQGARGWKEALTVAKARQRLSDELDRLGATYVTLSTNIELRLDGQPRSNQAEPGDPGVAAYFRLGGKQIALACDKWDRVADNIAALAKHIEASMTYTVASLAAEWECSEAVIRKEIAAGRLGHFRIGTLIRIPVEEARRYECQVTPSNDSEAPTPASSETSRPAPPRTALCDRSA